MGDEVARFVSTNEAFNVAIGEHVTGDIAQLLDFHRKWIDAVLRYLVDGGLLGTFIDWRGLPIVHASARALGLTPLDLIVWAKTNADVGTLYRSQRELLPLFKKGSASHVNNLSRGKRGRVRTNFSDSSSHGSDARKGLLDHWSEKPTARLEAGLIDLTNRGEVVLDPFLGSGLDAHRS